MFQSVESIRNISTINVSASKIMPGLMEHADLVLYHLHLTVKKLLVFVMEENSLKKIPNSVKNVALTLL